jgi:hypothetical protein
MRFVGERGRQEERGMWDFVAGFAVVCVQLVGFRFAGVAEVFILILVALSGVS